MKAARTVLVGIGGYGRVHLRHLQEFHARGEIVLAAAVVFPPEPDGELLSGLRAAGCELLDSFEALLAALPRLRIEFAVVPTPIHLHARMTVALLQAGVDVLVEKPLAATRAEAEAIVCAARETGRLVAVGFQYLHAPEVRALRERLVGGAIGEVRRLVVHAAWPRSHAYYTRNTWAGRLRLGEDWVLDSPVSNAMSHFLMVMLHLAARPGAELAEPLRMTAELYRAQAIESFDTAVLHLETAEGLRMDFYGTHSSARVGRPTLTVEGREGTAEWIQDSHARIGTTRGIWEQPAAPESDTRERMLREVLARRQGAPAWICTAGMAAEHVRCIERLQEGAAIVSVPEPELMQQRTVDGRFTYIRDFDEPLRRAASSGANLRDAGVKWAAAPSGHIPVA